MKTFVIFTFCWYCVSAYHGWGQSEYLNRDKRDAVGALDIVTNNAQAIHADVKHESAAHDVSEKGTDAEFATEIPHATEKPCPKNQYVPAVDAGTVFKVLPPQDALYEGKSLRKSLPHGTATTLDIVRSVNRLIALVVLAITMAIEFYPLIANMVNIVLQFLEI